MSRRPPPPNRTSNRPLLFTTQANPSPLSSQNSSTNSSVLSAASTQLDYDTNYLFNDTTIPNGPGTFVDLDTLPPPPPSPTTYSMTQPEWTSGFSTESRPITPPQGYDEEPEDTGAGIGG